MSSPTNNNYLLQTYIVTSKPKRISVADGFVHMLDLLKSNTRICIVLLLSHILAFFNIVKTINCQYVFFPSRIFTVISHIVAIFVFRVTTVILRLVLAKARHTPPLLNENHSHLDLHN